MAAKRWLELVAMVVAIAPACVTPVSIDAAAPPPPSALPDETLVVVASTDLHGYLAGHDELRRDGANVHVGGLALLSTYVARLREQHPDRVVLLDGGDLFQGTLVSNLSEGEAVIEGYNAIGYDASALGNHEFDFGPVGPESYAQHEDDDPLGALKARAKQARFPLLAANVIERESGLRPAWLRGSVLLERRGLKIGIVGVATPDTPATTLATNVRGLTFLPPAPAATIEARRLRAEGADVVLLVAHVGASCREGPCQGELLELVRALPDGAIDAAFGGHTHQVVEARVGGIPVLQTGSYGRSFAWLELAIDPVTRKPRPGTAKLRAAQEVCDQHAIGTDRCDPTRGTEGALGPAQFRGAVMRADPAMTARLAPLVANVAKIAAAPIGCSVSRRLVRDYQGESEIGSLVVDAMLDAVPEADLAITKSGGLRVDLPAGPLSYGHLFELIPFDNRLALLELNGAELRELLRVATTGVHGGMQVANVKLRLDPRPPQGCATKDVDGDGEVTPYDRVRLADVKVRGAPIDPAATYLVATNDYLASGGSGLEKVIGRLPKGRVKILEDRPLLRDALAAWLAGRGTLEPAAPGGRIELLGPAGACPVGR